MFEIIKYDNSFEERWDKFIEKQSINGTFLQTRNFLNYHTRGKYKDASIMVMQGSSIVAVIPACEIEDEDGKYFHSHLGSTFGGIVLSKDKYNITCLEELFPLLEEYLCRIGYSKVILKQTSDIFSSKKMDLLDYYFYKYGWESCVELSFYVDLNYTPNDLMEIMSASRRRDYRYSLKNKLIYRKLDSREDISDFFELLKENLQKHGTRPIHTLEELYDFKEKRLAEIVDFYGVFNKDNRMIAATMLFCFEKNVLHTQYLAQSQNAENIKLFAMEFLNYNIMSMAKERGFDKFSFGISTEEHGKVLNIGLATFKEGFGCDYCNNITYKKNIERKR